VALPIVAVTVLALVGVILEGGDKIALIHVEGVISAASGSSGILGSDDASSERIVRLLERARRDSRVKGVVLRINSPGGSAAASQEIYDEVRRVRAAKPVYVSMGDVAASGGYYVAAAANRIYANPATITGSIGVLMESPELSKLMRRLGIDFQVVKSGKFKDMGSPFRPLTPAEREIVQGMINDTFEQFIEAVASGRGMPKDEVRALATGRVYTGRSAKRLRLIDKLGGLRDAVMDIGRATGLGPEPKVQVYAKPSLLNLLFGSEARGWQDFFGRATLPTLPKFE